VSPVNHSLSPIKKHERVRLFTKAVLSTASQLTGGVLLPGAKKDKFDSNRFQDRYRWQSSSLSVSIPGNGVVERFCQGRFR